MFYGVFLGGVRKRKERLSFNFSSPTKGAGVSHQQFFELRREREQQLYLVLAKKTGFLRIEEDFHDFGKICLHERSLPLCS